ncbi:RlpA-like double-psi beta-barrel-protein domain-containing protein-containing protein [Trametes elegans]|nr:RlpA-like double-psi beta-barrel-protein domain-containing protein-containing protein [Trametes elegans]
MFVPKALLVLSVALSALASPHMARVNHHGVSRRSAMPLAEPEPEPVLAAPLRRRGNNKRCKARSSSAAPSSTAAPTTSLAAPLNVESDPTTSFTPSSTEAEATPTSSAAPTTKETPTTTKQEQPTTTKQEQPTTSAAPPAETSQASSGGSDQPSFMTGTQTGQGTFYATGLGSCGITNSDTDYIAAVSHLLYDSFPGYTGGNPNNNPVCGRKIKATYQGKSVTITVTDRCEACDTTDLDFSPAAFDQLADESVGRISGVTWDWL